MSGSGANLTSQYCATVAREDLAHSVSTFFTCYKDTSLLGLREKRADMTKDNTVIQTAENAADTLLYPLPSWIVGASPCSHP